MSGGKIDINISGGTSNIGNISQGDNNTNTVSSQSISSDAEKAFRDFFGHLERTSGSTQIDDQQITDLRREIVSLEKSLNTKPVSRDSLASLANALYKEYGWAADMLKKLFSVLVP